MFSKFFTPSTSKNSYPKSNISAISAANYLVHSICGTIYHNTTCYISSIINSAQNKATASKRNQQKILQALSLELTSNNETNKEGELQQLFQSSADQEFPKGYTKQFPEDYPNELHQFHQIIPEIKFLNPNKSLYKDIPPFKKRRLPTPEQQELEEHRKLLHLQGVNIIQELKEPITSPSELISMTKKWLRFQEIWGENFNEICYITETTDHQRIKHTKSKPSNYKQVVAISSNTDRLYHKILIRIFKEPESLKNLILILGLEYSFTHRTRGYGGYDSCLTDPTLNSVEYILREQTGIHHRQISMSTTLFHLAVKQNILPEVSFLLTKDNVNCESYDLVGKYFMGSRDTPLKIAIDNLDSEAVKTLLQYNADPKRMVKNEMRVIAPDYSTPLYLSISDSFINKEPQPGEKTTSYIAIANSLYDYLDDGEKISFFNKCRNKLITVDNNQEALISYINSKSNKKTKSAYKVGLQDIKEEEEELEANDATDENITNSGNKARKTNNLAHPNYCVAQDDPPSDPRIDITFAGDTDFPSTSGEQSEITKSSFCNLL